jgi:hypothetical protein
LNPSRFMSSTDWLNMTLSRIICLTNEDKSL